MDSSIPQVTLKGSTSDQSAGQGLSSVKKKGKGNDSPAGFIAMLGGLGSFASLLGEVSSEKNAKTFSGIPSTGEVSQAKTKEKWNPEMLRKTQILKGDEITGEDDTANLPKTSCVQEVEALSGGSVPERGKRILLKQGIGALGSAEKASSGDAKLSDGEAGIESAALSTGGLKGNGLARKNAVDGLRGLPDDETEDQRYRHDQNLSKASDVRGSNNGKVSPDPKGQEMLSIKDGTQYSADVKDNVTSIHQIQTQIEKIQSYKNLTSDVLKSEKSQENAPNDIQTGKTGSSLSTAQTDFSMVNGVWSDARTSMNDKTVAPVIFQEVAGQIIDGASNMLAKGSSRIVITLEPPNLGTLNMDVRVQHDMVSMLLTADNHEVKQVLQANLDQLKTALQGQGLNIDRFDVLVHERSYDGSQGFQPGGGTLFDRGRGKGDDTKDDSVRPPVLPSGGSEMNEPSLGIISLFV